MLNVFLNVILPTFLVAAAGAGLQRWRKLSPVPLTQVTLYLLSPALVLDTLINANLPAGVSSRIVFAILLMSGSLLLLSSLLSRALGHGRSMQSGFILSTVFPNAANMALPVSLLAFGEEGLAVAVMIFAVQAILSWSLGVFVAARSNSVGLGPLKQTLRLPIVWAIVAALIFRATGMTLPTPLAHPVHMLGQASIPVMLLVLGFQLERGVELEKWLSLLAALTLRLVGGALVGFGMTLLLGLEGVAQQTFIVVAGMPTAVFTIILATEFEAEPRFVTSAVIVSTLVSLLTVTVLITVVQGWLA